MAISYKPLWRLLVEKEMNKEALKRAANINSNIVSKIISLLGFNVIMTELSFFRTAVICNNCIAIN